MKISNGFLGLLFFWVMSAANAKSKANCADITVHGRAAPVGACSHVTGPIDDEGETCGFTCSDIGGNALLVWSEPSRIDWISVDGKIKTVNFFPGELDYRSSFTSNGDTAFIANRLLLNNNSSIAAANVLLASVKVSEVDLKNSLLASTPTSFIGTQFKFVDILNSRVKATSGKLIIAGRRVHNNGQLSAGQGWDFKSSVILSAGKKINISWDNAELLEATATDNLIINSGSIAAAHIILEAHRLGNTATTILNSGLLSATKVIEVITGVPGACSRIDGTCLRGFFGFADSTSGVTNTPFFKLAQYYVPPSPDLAAKPRIFDFSSKDDYLQYVHDFFVGDGHPGF